MVIKILERTPGCFTYEEGKIIGGIIDESLSHREMVTLSFDGVLAVSSSFINSAVAQPLQKWGADRFKQLVRFTDANTQIQHAISRRVNR